MSSKSLTIVCAAALCGFVWVADAGAQSRGHGGSRSGPSAGHAVPSGPRGGVSGPRGGPVYGGSRYGRPVYISPRIDGFVRYRPYYYPYRPGLTLGFYSGFGYGYGYGYPYGYPYSYYGYPYGVYGYNSGYYGYAAPPVGYVTARPGVAYGGVRIQDAPRDAQVFADGYYMGVAEDFDGPVRHLNLEAGPHSIEIRAVGMPPITFDVDVRPGQTMTVHAEIR